MIALATACAGDDDAGDSADVALDVTVATTPTSAAVGAAASSTAPPATAAPTTTTITASDNTTSETTSAATTAAPPPTDPPDTVPATTAPATSTTADVPLVLDTFAPDTVGGAGFEPIGCWLRTGESFDLPSVFFVGADGGLIVVDGTTVTLRNTTADSREPFRIPLVDDTYSQDGYAVTFVEVGPRRETSIESTDQDVVVLVASPDGRRTRVEGVLGCGV